MKQGFGFVDKRAEAVTQRTLQAMMNSIHRSRQMKAFHDVSNKNLRSDQVTKFQVLAKNDVAQRSVLIGKSIQRYPIELDELNDNNENPGVFTDTRHNWMRMRKSDLGETTFELLSAKFKQQSGESPEECELVCDFSH